MIELLMIGAATGLLSGLFGIGGGIILVPILKYYYQAELHLPAAITMQMAVTTSLAIIIFTTASSSYNYVKKKQVNFQLFSNMMPGSILGIVLGAVISHEINSHTYEKLFAILLTIVGIKLLFAKNRHTQTHVEQQKQILDFKFYIFSFISGFLSSLFGIGGGIINTPYFLHLKLNTLKAIATNSLCCLPVAIIGTLIHAVSNRSLNASIAVTHTTGLIHWPTVINIALTGIIFAPYGVKMALLIHPHRLKQLFAVILLACAFKMFF